jgi:uncharacterized phage-like protein YoqJ
MTSLAPAGISQPQGPYVAITGHRPPAIGGYKTPNPIYDTIVYGLAEAFNTFKPSYVLTGMSLGVDQWAAEICLNMDIPFVAVIPFEGQDKMWPPHSQSKYHWLLQKAVQKIVVSQGAFEPWKMQKRNEYLINNCHQVIAVWNGTPGGTSNCLAYAIKVGKPIYYVPLQPAGMVVGGGDPHAGTEKPMEKAAVENKTAKRVIDL